ncbi:FtsK/SpoIIIE domain-containing protein [Streptomyces sp. H27-C3]|uniref:FtsK/SpoIIIE domain-containing protein n=1 Tax=Streptomyces sp. H27-C3 TaxID=3046305 RepID=UPI0024BA41FF|nr:FtsK/SpoIIIE domain-containing protein [Streptomyces sp. H27-C3]MDJ0461194.1 FHA domain-containing protein [Streptomyces sp. H27-C3]
MQIRLTVLAPRSGQGAHGTQAQGLQAAAPAARACDVLVTAPAGTALAAVASGLAAAVSGPGSGPETTGAVVVYAGRERLDARHCALGEPPLVDGAVLSLHAPAPEGDTRPDAAPAPAPAQLHVVAGPDAGGVHLLHGGRISIGRSTDADVPLDDPDVSRLHCAVTLTEDGRVSVADLGSTNGTALDGTAVDERPVRLAPGALLRVGESALRLAPGDLPPSLPVAPDGEGHLRVTRAPDGPTRSTRGGPVPGAHGAPTPTDRGSLAVGRTGTEAADSGPAAGRRVSGRLAGTPPVVRSTGPYDTSGAAGATAQDSWSGPAHEAPGAAPYRSRSGAASEAGDERSRSAEERFGGAVRGPYESEPGPAAPGRPGDRSVSRPPAGRPGSGAAPTVPGQYVPEDGPTAAGRRGAGPYDDRYDDRAGAAPGAPGGAPHDARNDVRSGTESFSGQGGTRYSDPGPASETGGRAASGRTAGSTPEPADDREERAPEAYYSPADPAATAPGRIRCGGDGGTGDDVYGGRGSGSGHGSAGRPGSGDGTHGGRRGVFGEEQARRRGGIGAWARRLTGGRGETVPEYAPAESTPVGMPPVGAPEDVPPAASAAPETWPDPASLLLTALGPGPRLWERGPGHPETLVLRLGTADRAGPEGGRPLPAVPVTVGLREVGSLGLAGPRSRLAGLARSAVAQLAALHSPVDLEIVLISADRSRSLEERKAEWGWLGWLPHLRPAHGQDCRLLLAYDRDQAAARVAELVRRTDEEPLGGDGPYTVVIVDGDPGSTGLREATARLAATGAASGIHLLTLAETAAASPVSPVAATYEAACAAAPAFRECGAVALLSGDVATALRLLRTAGGQPVGHGTLATLDAVSAAWAERFARSMAPLRTDGPPPGRSSRAAVLPPSARLLDELGLARATPASLMARWAAAADDGQAPGATRAWAVLGAGPRGPLCVDLTTEGPHLLIEGPAGSGRTELLRSVAASLAAAARPDRLGLVLVDGAGGERGEGLRVCTELPHVSTHLVASDPLRMREFAQALGAELKRRHELLGGLGFAEWHTHREVSGRLVGQRPPSSAEQHSGDLDPPSSGGTLRLRTTTSLAQQARQDTAHSPLPRLVVLVDDLDALVAPALGSTGRPSAGSVVRALEAVAREGGRLGVHLVATSARPDRTADTELARGARLRVVLDAPPAAPSPEEPAPGRGRLHHADGPVTVFQGGRVTGRIPRTATLRPTVVPLEWERMGDPPTRRPVRELGNGPTDLALLASALDRAARTVNAAPLAPLSPLKTSGVSGTSGTATSSGAPGAPATDMRKRAQSPGDS